MSDRIDPADVHPYAPKIGDPHCVVCGKTMGEDIVCYRCRRRINPKDADEIEEELIKAYYRGRGFLYWRFLDLLDERIEELEHADVPEDKEDARLNRLAELKHQRRQLSGDVSEDDGE